jgi:fatty-acid desaturase
MSQSALQEDRPWERPFWKPLPAKTPIFVYLVLVHVLAVVGLFLFPLPDQRVLIANLVLTCLGGLGTTVCYHRLLAHRTFKLNNPV